MAVFEVQRDRNEHPRAGDRRSCHGCLTCRRRKVKCDEVKPSCGACVRLQRVCSWAREWKFVDQTDTVRSGYEVFSGPAAQQQQQRLVVLNAIEYAPQKKIAVSGSRRGTRTCEEAREEVNSISTSLQRKTPAGLGPRIWKKPPQGYRMPLAVDAGPTTRSQLLVVALYHYVPTNEPKDRQGDFEQPRLTFLNFHNPAIFSPQSSFLTATVDTFSLVQAALSLGDVRLGIAAIRRYSTCLTSLNSALSRSEVYDKNEVLLCILTLSLLESMRPISQFGGWASHVRGAIKFLERQGPKPLKTRYESVLFHHARQAAILWGIFHQTPIPFSGHEWMIVSKSAFMVSDETRLIDIGTKIPDLLAARGYQHDGLKGLPGVRLHFEALCLTCEEISAWIDAFYQEKLVILQVCDAVIFPSYFEQVKENVLPEAFMFQNFNDAWYLSTAWTYLYLLQTTCLTILLSNGDDINAGLWGSYIQSTVSNLCKTIPQALGTDSAFSGRLSVNLFLQPITMYFEAQAHTAMVSWCRSVESALYKPDRGHAGSWMSDWSKIVTLPAINDVAT